MTREERHIAVLSRLLENMDVYDSVQPTEERKKAIKAAIKALSQEPRDDAISREDVMDWLENATYEDVCEAIGTNLDFLPPVIPKPETVTEFADRCRECGKMKKSQDAISREAVLNLIEKGECLSNGAVKKLPPVTPSRITLDDVKRFATENNYALLSKEIYSQAIKAMDESSRHKGHWERIDGCMSDRRCSNCREQVSYEKIGRFCIKCGAEMESDTDAT